MSGAPKCGKCGKTVYDQEKQAYRGGFWHDFCFRCQACNSRLTTGAQVDHKEMPYCKSCYDKNFRPKGFHGASTTDSFTPAAGQPAKEVHASSPVNVAPTDAAVAAAAPAASTGGKFCTKCGEIKKAGMNFCGNCGTKC